MGKKSKSGSKSKKKNTNNKKVQNNNNKTTIPGVEPATTKETVNVASTFIDSVVSSSSTNSVKNDSGITTTDTFTVSEKITKESEAESSKEPIVTTTQTLNPTEPVKNNLNEEPSNSLSTTNINDNTSLSPKDNPIIMATIHAAVASYHLDTQSIIEKVIDNINSSKKEIMKKDEVEEKANQPIPFSPKDDPIIMSAIHSVTASHSLDISSIVSTVIKNNNKKDDHLTTKDEEKKPLNDQNKMEISPIIKSTIDSVVATYNLDPLSIINKLNDKNKPTVIDSLQQSKVKEEKNQPITASPTPSHTSSFKNSQNILNGSFHGKSGSPPHTETINATGQMLSMPEPALTSASLKGKGPLIDKRASTISVSKDLPPTPVKGLPEIPSDENIQQRAATSNGNNKPEPITKEKKKLSTFFDKKKDKSKDKNKDKKICLIQ